jgi:hypothetical protein
LSKTHPYFNSKLPAHGWKIIPAICACSIKEALSGSAAGFFDYGSGGYL